MLLGWQEGMCSEWLCFSFDFYPQEELAPGEKSTCASQKKNATVFQLVKKTFWSAATVLCCYLIVFVSCTASTYSSSFNDLYLNYPNFLCHLLILALLFLLLHLLLTS